jgi:hypothetical protein
MGTPTRFALRSAALSSTILAAAVVAAPAGASAGPGCQPKRVAVAHRPGAVRLAHQPARAPIPCLTTAGITTDSAPVAVTRKGTVLYAPIAAVRPGSVPPPANIALPTGVARTVNGGARWRTVLPVDDPADEASQHSGLIPWLYADRTTGRIWYATPLLSGGVCGAMISYSDDEGVTWRDNDHVGCPGQGGMSVFEGPAPARSARPVGYRHVVYYCANLLDGGSHLMHCYRSLNGGSSFEHVKGFPNSSTPPPSCGAGLDAPRGRGVAPDGTIYMVVDRCDEGVGLAQSRDEGDTWRQTPLSSTVVANLPITSLAIDRTGTLYVAWTRADDLRPYLTISRDHGATWSRPVMVAAPGVDQIDPRTLAVAVDRPGHVAIAYSGSPDKGATYNGYLAESEHARGSRALWWSAAVNDPTHPLSKGPPSVLYGDREWFSTVAFGVDGTPWAGFHCVRTDLCPRNRVGMVGRLAPHFGFGRLVRNTEAGTATLRVDVPGPGSLVLTGPQLKKVARRVAREGTATVPVRARGRALRALRAKGTVEATAKVTFSPVGGSPRVERAHVTLVLR